MRRLFFSLLFFPSLCFCIAETEAEKIATEIYIYGYPLITMDLTRQVMTNTVTIDGAKAPMGQFVNLRSYPSASMKEVTTPNADTLYSWVWLDLSKEPYIFHVPDEIDRYYVVSILSGWTEVFADPGTRTKGTKAADYAITGPNWKGKLPVGIKQLKSPTNLVWVIGRTYCSGTLKDYAAVHQIQDQYSVVPLSSYGKPYNAPPGTVDPDIDMVTPVRNQVNQMDPADFFNRLALLMKDNPATAEDQKMIEKMKKIGFIPGKPFDLASVDQTVAGALQRAPEFGVAKIMQQGEDNGKIVDGWLV